MILSVAARLAALSIAAIDMGAVALNALLNMALHRLSGLPEVEQEAIASLILDELEAERAWETRFAETDDGLGELVRRARAEVAAAGALTYDPGDRPAR